MIFLIIESERIIMRNKYILLFITILSVSLIIFFINYENKIDVKTIKVIKGNIKEYISEDAKTIFDKEYEISSTISGDIEPLKFEIGDNIKKDQIITNINTFYSKQNLKEILEKENEIKALINNLDKQNPRSEDFKEIKLIIEELENRLKQSEKQIQISKINYEKSKDFFNRQKELKNQESITDLQYNEAKTSFEISKKQFEISKLEKENILKNISLQKNNYEKLKERINDNEFQKKALFSQIEQLNIQKNINKNNLKKMSIYSPVSGVITDIFLKDLTTISSGTKIIKISDPKSIEIESDILSDEIFKIKKGQKVEISGKSLNDKTIIGYVKKVFPSGFTKISSLGVEQQRIKIRISFDNKNINLKSGTNLDIKIIVNENNNTIIVPERSIFKDNNKWKVLSVDNKKVVLKEILIGLKNDDFVEVLKGLSVNDIIIEEPNNNIKEGSLVNSI